jgi:hypothetical protein
MILSIVLFSMQSLRAMESRRVREGSSSTTTHGELTRLYHQKVAENQQLKDKLDTIPESSEHQGERSIIEKKIVKLTQEINKLEHLKWTDRDQSSLDSLKNLANTPEHEIYVRTVMQLRDMSDWRMILRKALDNGILNWEQYHIYYQRLRRLEDLARPLRNYDIRDEQ